MRLVPRRNADTHDKPSSQGATKGSCSSCSLTSLCCCCCCCCREEKNAVINDDEPVAGKKGSASVNISGAPVRSTPHLLRDPVPFTTQTYAVARKNLTFALKNKCTNICYLVFAGAMVGVSYFNVMKLGPSMSFGPRITTSSEVLVLWKIYVYIFIISSYIL